MKNKKAFTLMELVVVMVIMAIVAAIVVPSVALYMKSQGNKNCKKEITMLLDDIQHECSSQRFTTDDQATRLIVKTIINHVEGASVTGNISGTETTITGQNLSDVTAALESVEVGGVCTGGGVYEIEWTHTGGANSKQTWSVTAKSCTAHSSALPTGGQSITFLFTPKTDGLNKQVTNYLEASVEESYKPIFEAVGSYINSNLGDEPEITNNEERNKFYNQNLTAAEAGSPLKVFSDALGYIDSSKAADKSAVNIGKEYVTNENDYIYEVAADLSTKQLTQIILCTVCDNSKISGIGTDEKYYAQWTVIQKIKNEADPVIAYKETVKSNDIKAVLAAPSLIENRFSRRASGCAKAYGADIGTTLTAYGIGPSYAKLSSVALSIATGLDNEQLLASDQRTLQAIADGLYDFYYIHGTDATTRHAAVKTAATAYSGGSSNAFSSFNSNTELSTRSTSGRHDMIKAISTDKKTFRTSYSGGWRGENQYYYAGFKALGYKFLDDIVDANVHASSYVTKDIVSEDTADTNKAFMFSNEIVGKKTYICYDNTNGTTRLYVGDSTSALNVYSYGKVTTD